MLLYIDTSVIGGVFDEEFSQESKLFFDHVREGKFGLIVSSLTEQELLPAPEHIRNYLSTVPDAAISRITISSEAESLAEQYIAQGAVSPQSAADALHIAVATLSSAQLVLSWNFKHIVNIFRIRKYNSVNLLFGYRQLEIRSPKELIYGQERI